MVEKLFMRVKQKCNYLFIMLFYEFIDSSKIIDKFGRLAEPVLAPSPENEAAHPGNEQQVFCWIWTLNLNFDDFCLDDGVHWTIPQLMALRVI